ncbi:MAG: hypothetical protein WCY95_10220, partial [Castellaniella sp.]
RRHFVKYFQVNKLFSGPTIYRVSKTPHADKFFLKGALMLRAWGGPGVRPTMDIEFWAGLTTAFNPLKAS